MKKSITLRAPAKVNLVLKVLNKRPDGYHDILSLFERILIADTITISKIPAGIELISNPPSTTLPQEDIAYKAAALMVRRFHLKGGVRIRITKRIPVAGGMGGGSSDAAAVMLGIDRLFALKRPTPELIALGSRLGADIGFFLLDKPCAVGGGRGDRLVPFDLKGTLWHLVVNRGHKISTREIYGQFDRLTGVKKPEKAPFGLTTRKGGARIRLPYGKTVFDSIEAMLTNDLEQAAIEGDRALKQVLERLATSTRHRTLLSGSGPSVFCLFRTQKEAIAAKRRIRRDIPASERKDWRFFIAKTAV